MFIIPHFYTIWKILKNPPIGIPIVAGYDWILTPASIFVEHFIKEFYSKFDSILTDSLSLVKLMENAKFNEDVFVFTLDFKSLYTNFPVEDAINSIKELVMEFDYVIPNAEFIVERFSEAIYSETISFHERHAYGIKLLFSPFDRIRLRRWSLCVQLKKMNLKSGAEIFVWGLHQG